MAYYNGGEVVGRNDKYVYIQLVGWVLNTYAPNFLSISESARAKGKTKGEIRHALSWAYHYCYYLRINN